MKFMEALDKLQDGHCIGICQLANPVLVIRWNKTEFKDFYNNKTIEISKEQLFAADWVLFEYNMEAV